MGFTDFLKAQLLDFVDSYKKFFRLTFEVTIIYTVLCFVIAALLLRFGNFDSSVTLKQISLLSYFFHRYSKGDTYSLVDLIKTVFIFSVSLFSIGMVRQLKGERKQSEVHSRNFFTILKINDVLLLVFALTIAAIIDFILFKLENLPVFFTRNINASLFIHNTFFHLRIYLPLILFALVLWLLSKDRKEKLTFKGIIFLYISLWLFNEFAFEISLWVRDRLFSIILIPFTNSANAYLIESFMGIPLIAFFFLGYYSAMSKPILLMHGATHSS